MRNMVAKRALWALVLSPLCFSQSPTDLFDQAPPAVEKALRERVGQFYTLMGEGKYRAADALVAEEAKDAFFEADKRRCYKFSVSKIIYADQFSSAQVLITCEADVYVKPIGNRRLAIPQTSYWKVAAGTWSWVAPPKENTATPFGTMAGKRDEGTQPLITRGPSVADLKKMFRADRTNVQLDHQKPGSATIELSNDMPGDLKLTIEPLNVPDVTAKLASKTIGPKQSTTLTIDFTPGFEGRRLGSFVYVQVSSQPLNETIAVKVSFN